VISRGSLLGRADDPSDEFALDILDADLQIAQDGINFRWSAPTTQARQDLHIKELLNFYRVCKTISEDSPHDFVKQMLFSQDFREVMRR
jgi:hypothetical protein